MKNLLFFLALSLSTVVNAQTFQHHDYLTHYNPALKTPDSVSWSLSPAMVNCMNKVGRSNHFAADPQIPGSPQPSDYAVNHNVPRINWIDLGHLFNAQDAACDRPYNDECYYTTNMLPQYQSFNQGDWKSLEIAEQEWAKTRTLHIVAGGIGSRGHLPSGENIPQYMYKAIYIDGQWACYIMYNDPSSKGHGYEPWQRSITELNGKTGLNLK
jgi:endonuclease G